MQKEMLVSENPIVREASEGAVGKKNMLLVIGATGLVGSEVCKRLRKRGEPVRALVRATSSRNKIEALRLCGTELCFGDLKDADSIAAACRCRRNNLNRNVNLEPPARGLDRVCGRSRSNEPVKCS